MNKQYLGNAHRVPFVSAFMVMLSACVGGSGDNQIDPRLGEAPVAYVTRTVPVDEDGVMLSRNEREPVDFFPGGELVIRDAASPQAVVRPISSRIFTEPHDVRDLSASFDGRRLLFAMRAPELEDADEDEQPRWNIWEFDADTDTLRRLIVSDLIAEEGNDLMPRYLPDGRIVFISDRQRQSRARLLDEGKPQFAPQDEDRQVNALALHVMNSDGSDIQQISFNMSHDLSPLVMDDGRLLMVRWDNSDVRDDFNLYALNPDGSGVDILYGADSHDPEDPTPLYTAPQWLGDGRVLVMKRENESANWSGLPLAINVAEFINNDQPIALVAGQAESPFLDRPVSATAEIASGGRFNALVPLNDGTGRLIASWAPCRLQLPDTATLLACTEDNLARTDLVEAPPAYGLWVFDQASNRQLPVVPPQDGRMINDIAVLARRNLPAFISDGQPGLDRDLALFERDAGLINIRSVYDFAGQFNPLMAPVAGVTTLADFADPALLDADQRAVRFLRISKGVLIPDRDVVQINGADIGRLAAVGMREIVGYVPVAPDGSVRVEVPANVPLDLQLVDARGRRLGPRHTSWLTVRPGEELHCVGCHEADSPLPHGRRDAELPSINEGAPVTGLPFPNTDPALFADAGETMAEVLTRIDPSRRQPSLDMLFDDVWTDPALRPADPSLTLRYADLQTPAPATEDCQTSWTPLCRSIIHYAEHIQSLWDLARTVDIGGIATDVTCSSCHNRRDAANALQVPAGQLELTADISPEQAAQRVSYRELLFPDNELELVDGALVDATRQAEDDQGNPLFVADEEGNLVLDQNDQPIPVLEPIPINSPMVAGTARAGRFFALFVAGGSHAGWLSDAEQRLLAEWLDIGGQNFNDPFAVPQ